jgi:hypothetical protein
MESISIAKPGGLCGGQNGLKGDVFLWVVSSTEGLIKQL